MTQRLSFTGVPDIPSSIHGVIVSEEWGGIPPPRGTTRRGLRLRSSLPLEQHVGEVHLGVLETRGLQPVGVHQDLEGGG
eukprot:8838286-Pyramimonas_sp.AAC.1